MRLMGRTYRVASQARQTTFPGIPAHPPCSAPTSPFSAPPALTAQASPLLRPPAAAMVAHSPQSSLRPTSTSAQHYPVLRIQRRLRASAKATFQRSQCSCSAFFPRSSSLTFTATSQHSPLVRHAAPYPTAGTTRQPFSSSRPSHPSSSARRPLSSLPPSRPLHTLSPTRSHSQGSMHASNPLPGESNITCMEATCVRVVLGPVTAEMAELMSDALLGLGAQSIVVLEHRAEGAPEQEIFQEPGLESQGGGALWDSCSLGIYFDLQTDVMAALSSAADASGLLLDPSTITIEPVVNEEWVDQIKASYVPLQLSPRLYIVPEWSEPPSDPGIISIILQPGVAFGTGEHPTTRMCLELLEEQEQKLMGSSVMDYGAGSGILALAALKLGAADAVLTDTDPLAVRSAKRNAELNGVPSGSLTVLQVTPFLDGPEPLQEAGLSRRAFDVVVSNILRGPLLDLQPRLSAYVRPGGLLLLSGILETQVPEVMEAYSPLFEDVKVKTDGQWAAVSAVRRA